MGKSMGRYNSASSYGVKGAYKVQPHIHKHSRHNKLLHESKKQLSARPTAPSIHSFLRAASLDVNRWGRGLAS